MAERRREGSRRTKRPCHICKTETQDQQWEGAVQSRCCIDAGYKFYGLRRSRLLLHLEDAPTAPSTLAGTPRVSNWGLMPLCVELPPDFHCTSSGAPLTCCPASLAAVDSDQLMAYSPVVKRTSQNYQHPRSYVEAHTCPYVEVQPRLANFWLEPPGVTSAGWGCSFALRDPGCGCAYSTSSLD